MMLPTCQQAYSMCSTCKVGDQMTDDKDSKWTGKTSADAFKEEAAFAETSFPKCKYDKDSCRTYCVLRTVYRSLRIDPVER